MMLLSIMRRWYVAMLLAIDEFVHVVRSCLFLVAGRSGRLPVSEAAPRAEKPLVPARPELLPSFRIASSSMASASSFFSLEFSL